MASPAAEDFEENVRRIARNLFPQAQSTGAAMHSGRERDGVFETPDAIHIIEATLRRDKKKIEEDSKKKCRFSEVSKR